MSFWLTTIRVAYTDVPVITAENASLASIRRSANYTGNRGRYRRVTQTALRNYFTGGRHGCRMVG